MRSRLVASRQKNESGVLTDRLEFHTSSESFRTIGCLESELQCYTGETRMHLAESHMWAGLCFPCLCDVEW